MAELFKTNFDEIMQMDRIFRVNLINSITGFKSANLIGSISKRGITNLAIFGSVFHIGSNPPYLGFMVRPAEITVRNTYQNILDTKEYTINHVKPEFIKNAHKTSARWDAEISEFDKCGFTKEYSDKIKAPYVAESDIKIGLELAKKIDVDLNGTHIFFGRVMEIIAPLEFVKEDGYIDLQSANSVAIGGCDAYHSTNKLQRFAYARTNKDIESLEF